jgi:hypothetical protein
VLELGQPFRLFWQNVPRIDRKIATVGAIFIKCDRAMFSAFGIGSIGRALRVRSGRRTVRTIRPAWAAMASAIFTARSAATPRTPRARTPMRSFVARDGAGTLRAVDYSPHHGAQGFAVSNLLRRAISPPEREMRQRGVAQNAARRDLSVPSQIDADDAPPHGPAAPIPFGLHAP